jgi:primosomal protein N'
MKEKTGTQHVVEVIPLVRGLPKSSLSYFSSEKPELGSFVNIKIRNSEAFGLVTRVIPAQEVKTELKNSIFALRKLSNTSKSSSNSLNSAFMEAVGYMSLYYALPIGNILGALLPKAMLESPELLGDPNLPIQKESFTTEPLLIQLPDEERYREYKSMIRGAFARGESVMFITPTHEDALRAAFILSQGIKEYVYTTARKSPKGIRETLVKARDITHPILFITTPSYAAFNRSDFHSIILEKENSKLYRTISRPHIDFKVFIEKYAAKSNRKIIFGDSILSLGALYKEKQGSYAEMSPLKWKTQPRAKVSLINMKPHKNEEQGKQFEIFSKEMKEMITKAMHERRKVFLFGVRKGLFPSTVCRDCGQVLPCPNCGAPIVLHEGGNKGRHYLCHACGATRNSETRCDNCNSWNLEPLGIGASRIALEVGNLFPDTPVYIMDKEHAHTSKQAVDIAQKFASGKGGVMVGTELALLYLEKVPYSGIVSLDSLFSIPDFGIHERIFYLAGRILEKTECESIIQSRNIGKSILAQAAKGDILDFYRTEMQERKDLGYPPFTLFIKVTTQGPESELESKARFLNKEFKSYSPDFMKERGLKTGKLNLSMILRVQRGTWPDKELADKLSLLSPDFLIKVDPESIL